MHLVEQAILYLDKITDFAKLKWFALGGQGPTQRSESHL